MKKQILLTISLVISLMTSAANVEIWKSGTLQNGYTTLKLAFDAVNAGTYTGDLDIKINGSSTETVSAVLNASGTGSASYASVHLYPTVSGLSINGSLATPLIDLNGADNVIIDGRVNGLGTERDLTIVNSSASAVAGTSTIRFIGDATNNTVEYCKIQGSQTNAAGGVVFFSTAGTGTGNDGNIIDNNDITSSTTRPYNAI